MGQRIFSNHGQSVLSEYILVIFIVIGAIVSVTVYVQRALEGRLHDARNYAFISVMDNSVCDANCVKATGNVYTEYEPYYTHLTVQSEQNESHKLTQTTGNPLTLGAVYGKTVNDANKNNSVGCQQPPQCAGLSAPLPCFCNCPETC